MQFGTPSSPFLGHRQEGEDALPGQPKNFALIGTAGYIAPRHLKAIDDTGERAKIVWAIIRYAESELDATERCNLASELGRRMGVSYDTIAGRRALSIMSPSEIADAAARGIDIQLHCHRHRLPEDAVRAQQEINENRAVLGPLTDAALTHLCYPSGDWSEKHVDLLRRVRSAARRLCSRSPQHQPRSAPHETTP